jgi:hypothetical protein
MNRELTLAERLAIANSRDKVTRMDERLSQMRLDIAEVRDYAGMRLEHWQAETRGPFWPFKRRFVMLFFDLVELLDYVDELYGIIKEQEDSSHGGK